MNIGNLEVYGIIYKVENLVNGKVYIGQTTEDKGFDGRYCRKGEDVERVYKQNKRLKELGLSYNKHLLSSIEKYGFDNFKVDKELDYAFSRNELNIKEQCWISIFNSFNNGYNNNHGGAGNSGYEGLKGIDNPMSREVVQLSLEGIFIKTWDCMEYVSQALNINKAHICGVCNNTYGRKSTGGYMFMYKEDYQKLTNKDTIHYNNEIGEYNKEPVMKLDLNGKFIQEFNSISEASRLVNGATIAKISKCCKKERKSNGGFIWIYKKDYSDNNTYSWNGIHNGKSKEVIQLSLNGDFISEYSSITEASKFVKNTSVSKISKCCNGNSKSHASYIWVFKNDYNKDINYKLDTKHTGKSKKIIKLSLNGDFLNEYDSAKEAEESNNISRKAITKCCSGKSKTSGGYIWKYKEDYNKIAI